MARTPADNGYGLFLGGQLNVALDGGGKKRPPRVGGKRPPGNGALGQPVGPLAGNGIGGKFSRPSAATRNGKPVA